MSDRTIDRIANAIETATDLFVIVVLLGAGAVWLGIKAGVV